MNIIMEKIEVSKPLKDKLQTIATGKNTDIDGAIHEIMRENEKLKNKPDNYYDTTKISSKENKNSKGKVTSYSYSTAIPKPILNKLGLHKGQVLYWDIDKDNNIKIIPEGTPVPEDKE